MQRWTNLSRQAGLILGGAAVGVSLAIGCSVYPWGESFLAASRFLLDPWGWLFPAPQELTAEQPVTTLPLLSPSPQPETQAAPSAAPEESRPAEEKPEDWGDILVQTYAQASGTGAIPLPYGSIKNYTKLNDSQVADYAGAGLPFEIELNSSQPQILIMHTHATETYNLQSERYFDPEWTARTTDTAQNVCAVGQAITDALNAGGINTIHDQTLHDYPSYTGSYAASKATVQQYLAQYPSIKVVLDVHRDAIEKDGQRVAASCEIAGESAAQIMIICGCDKNGNLPNYRKNLAFAAALESQTESLYPGLTRPVLFDYRYYNQDLTTGSLLIEVGSHGNTLAQAVYSGKLVGQALVSLFTS